MRDRGVRLEALRRPPHSAAHGKNATEQASAGKSWKSDAQNLVVDWCLQVLGGYGYMNEYPNARMFADACVQKIYGGPNAIMTGLISRGL